MTPARRLAAALILAACSGRQRPEPEARPPDVVVTPADAVTAEDSAVDPRLAELAARWDASRLAVGGTSAAEVPRGPILQLVGGEVHVDDGPITSGAAILIWADRDVPIGTLLPHVASVPADAQIYLATTRSDSSLGWLRARALEQDRCAAWLSVTSADVADVVAAIGDDLALEADLVTDGRLCGASWHARLDALRAAGGSLFVRADAGGVPACSELAFESEASLVRAATTTGHPRLAFEYAEEDDTLELVGPVGGKPPKSTAVVRCKSTFAVTDEDADSLRFHDWYLLGMGITRKRAGRLFYTEAACLAADAPAKGEPDCLGSVLASTSSLPDAVVDRVSAVAARKGSLYVVDDGCRAFSFAARTTRAGGDRTDTTVAYDGFSIRVTDTTVADGGGAGATGSVDVYESVRPVIHTSDDYVLVDGARWYLTAKACQRG